MKEILYAEKAPPPIGPYSQAVRAGEFVFVSGQLPINPLKDELIKSPFPEAVHQTLRNLRTVLAAGGMDLGDVVQVTIFVKDLKRFAELNQIYATYFEKDPPARAVVEVSELPRGADLEMTCTAWKKR